MIKTINVKTLTQDKGIGFYHLENRQICKYANQQNNIFSRKANIHNICFYYTCQKQDFLFGFVTSFIDILLNVMVTFQFTIMTFTILKIHLFNYVSY